MLDKRAARRAEKEAKAAAKAAAKAEQAAAREAAKAEQVAAREAAKAEKDAARAEKKAAKRGESPKEDGEEPGATGAATPDSTATADPATGPGRIGGSADRSGTGRAVAGAAVTAAGAARAGTSDASGPGGPAGATAGTGAQRAATGSSATSPAPAIDPAAAIDPATATGPATGTDSATATDPAATDAARPDVDSASDAATDADPATGGGAPDGEDADGRATGTRRSKAPVLVVIMLLLLAVAGGAAAYVFKEKAADAGKQRPSSNLALLDKAATAEAVAQVSRAVEAIYSYDASSLDADEARALSMISGSYASEFKQNFAAVRALPANQRASLSSKVVAAGVITLTERRASLLVMLDQEGRQADKPEPVKAAVRLSVTAQRVDGQWKVSGVNQK